MADVQLQIAWSNQKTDHFLTLENKATVKLYKYEDAQTTALTRAYNLSFKSSVKSWKKISVFN